MRGFLFVCLLAVFCCGCRTGENVVILCDGENLPENAVCYSGVRSMSSYRKTFLNTADLKSSKTELQYHVEVIPSETETGEKMINVQVFGSLELTEKIPNLCIMNFMLQPLSCNFSFDKASRRTLAKDELVFPGCRFDRDMFRKMSPAAASFESMHCSGLPGQETETVYCSIRIPFFTPTAGGETVLIFLIKYDPAAKSYCIEPLPH